VQAEADATRLTKPVLKIGQASLSPSSGSEIRLVGREGTLAWVQEGANLAVKLPDSLNDSYAYALKITPARAR
jgi:hypothetical protein